MCRAMAAWCLPTDAAITADWRFGPISTAATESRDRRLGCARVSIALPIALAEQSADYLRRLAISR